MLRRAGLVAGGVLALALALPPVAPAVADPNEDDAALREAIEELIDEHELDAVPSYAVTVTYRDGTEILRRHADKPMLPASTVKLLTAAAAYRLLGPDYRYQTMLYADGPIEEGTLHGDLFLRGGGDPALASPLYLEQIADDRPSTPLAPLVDAVTAAGISEVRGRVIADVGRDGHEPLAEGWPDRYLANLDTSRVTALTIDAGRALTLVGEQDEEDEQEPVLLAAAAADPARTTAEVLTDLLIDAGVEVQGDPLRGVTPWSAVELGRVESPPLRDLLAVILKASDNQMADGVFRSLGAATGSPTWSGSSAAVQATLTDLALPWDGAVVVDGSGLSRDNLLSAELLADLDRTFTDTHGPAWRDLMAVGAEDGTLRNRWHGTAAAGRVTGKTGFLQDAVSLVAEVQGASGEHYHLTVLSKADWPELGAVRPFSDDLAVLLAEQ